MKKKNDTPIPLPFELGGIIDNFIFTNCRNLYTADFAPHEYRPPFAQSEIRIVLNPNGDGYMHVLGRDSETINFNLDGVESRNTSLKFPVDLDSDVNSIISVLKKALEKDKEYRLYKMRASGKIKEPWWGGYGSKKK